YLDMCESGKEDIVWGIVYKKIEYVDKKRKRYWEQHIGNISLQRINWIYRSAEFAIIIGEKDYWKSGIGFEALTILFKHGFDKLNLHRIWTGTASSNEGMNKLCMKLGMTLEGIFYDGIFLNGKYRNINCYSIMEDHWKQINR
ncbi:MAG: GNAT family N-acetyltransferase, partial [Melioribacteraceae bacterium]|nr:GNAT family N-acetyltransferase [Melioribacteraceae bacterium]